MGRLIDYNNVYNAIQITTDDFGVAKKVVEDNMLTMLSKIETVEAIPKADYEARVRADMLSMLYKLRSEIINMPKYFPYADHTRWFIDGDVFGLIDKKINALKENEDGRN